MLVVPCVIFLLSVSLEFFVCVIVHVLADDNVYVYFVLYFVYTSFYSRGIYIVFGFCRFSVPLFA